MFSRLLDFLRKVIHKMIPYKSIESVEGIESPVSTEMVNALDLWYAMYTDTPFWRNADEGILPVGLPAFICTEIARQITLDAKYSITGIENDAGETASNPRAEFLAEEFKKLEADLRKKVELGCAAGGMVIKPYVRDNHLYFDFAPDWSIYPLAFDDDSRLADVVFRDSYTEGKTFYTRLERHQINGDSVTVTQRAFKSSVRDAIGTEIPLSAVKPWAELVPEAVVERTGGPLFGWFKVASANNVDTESPLGVSVFSRVCSLIKDADEQYSRMKWEFEGSELAVDVDQNVLKRKKDGTNGLTMPRLKERLFRGVDLGKDDNYSVFSPPIRDESLINGFNRILMRIEDECGLARGMLSDVNTEARTASELIINKQRYYATVADNQAALEVCLRDVIRVMNVYASLYDLAPEGDYDISVEWDDSIIVDTNQELAEHMMLLNAGVESRVSLRMWYYGETEAQAKEAIAAIDQERMQTMAMAAMMPTAPMISD